MIVCDSASTAASLGNWDPTYAPYLSSANKTGASPTGEGTTWTATLPTGQHTCQGMVFEQHGHLQGGNDENGRHLASATLSGATRRWAVPDRRIRIASASLGPRP